LAIEVEKMLVKPLMKLYQTDPCIISICERHCFQQQCKLSLRSLWAFATADFAGRFLFEKLQLLQPTCNSVSVNILHDAGIASVSRLHFFYDPESADRSRCTSLNPHATTGNQHGGCSNTHKGFKQANLLVC
jgi:hypothetical protein